MANKMDTPLRNRVVVPNKSGDVKGAMDHNPSGAFNKPRETSGMIPQRFSDDSILSSSKRMNNKMNTPVTRTGPGIPANMTGNNSSTVKKTANKYDQAGKTKQN